MQLSGGGGLVEGIARKSVLEGTLISTGRAAAGLSARSSIRGNASHLQEKKQKVLEDSGRGLLER